MNEKQRRLIDYFQRLRDPAPPARPAAVHEESVEESLLPPPAPPSAPSVASVRAMLERRRAQETAAGSAAGAELEESIFGDGAAPPERGLLSGPAPVELPLTDHTIEVALAATEKVLNEAELTFEEQEIFEAIVVPGKRPVLDVTGGDISAPPPGWEYLDDFRPLIREVLPAIGRINMPGVTSPPYAGTGFFVGPGLLLTNRHVANHFVRGVGAGPAFLTFQSERSARLDPRYEVGDPDTPAGGDRFRIVEPLLVHPHWDAALFRVEPVGDAALPRPLRLARRPPPHFGGGSTPQVVVIGYPALDSRNDIEQQMNIFRKIFNRKRLMPGYMVGFQDVTTRWEARLHAATHDASTLGGNSGSAVIDLSTGLVLGLHFGGAYLVANYAVPSWELAQDSRVVDHGVSFADDPGSPAGDGRTLTGGATAPGWLSAWDSVRPLVAEAPPSGGGAGAVPAELPVLPAAPDWFERTSHVELAEALRRDRQLTEQLIRETLLPEEADDLIADLELGLRQAGAESVEEGLFDFLQGGGPVDPTLPEIIFLHGIMGSHLATYGGLGGRVWLSPLAFVAGGIAGRLALADDGERDRAANQTLYPDGHVRMVYEKAARKWRLHGFVVHEFAFDWRKPIANAAERLHLFIETLRLERPGKKFALVGHSMGGLVAALYAARHPEWSARVAQAVFLGSPLRGSFAPVEALLGSYPILQKVADVDLKDDLGDYITMARTLPGLIDMLPDPDLFPDVAPLYQRSNWPQASAPAQVWLDQSRQLKRILATSPILETARLIVAHGHPTVGAIALTGGQLRAGRQNLPGDGTVPTRSAAASVAGVTVYRASFQHVDLPREDRVIAAVESLLQEGRCDLPTLSAHERDDLTPIEEAVTEAIEEAARADLSERLRAGILTQRDVDFLLRGDHATLPGPVGAGVAIGGA